MSTILEFPQDSDDYICLGGFAGPTDYYREKCVPFEHRDFQLYVDEGHLIELKKHEVIDFQNKARNVFAHKSCLLYRFLLSELSIYLNLQFFPTVKLQVLSERKTRYLKQFDP